MTNDWIMVTNQGRQQSNLRKYVEYTEDDSADDVYLEDISSYSKLMLLHEVYTVSCLFPLVSESNAIPVDQFQNYIQITNKLKNQYRVRITLQIVFLPIFPMYTEP